VLSPVPDYTAWWQAYRCNRCEYLAKDYCIEVPGWESTRDLSVVSFTLDQ